MEKFEDSNLSLIKSDFESGDIDIDLGEIWDTLKKGWKRIMFWAIGALVLGCVVALSIPHKYTVVSKLAPELSGTAVSRLTSLSSLTGMNANLLGSTDAVYPMVYPDILSSTPFITDLFDLPVEFVSKKEKIDTSLFAYITDYTKAPWWAIAISSPMKLASWVSGLISGEQDCIEDDANTPVDPFRLTKKQGMVAKALGKSITAEVDKKTLGVTISVTMQDPEVTAAVSRAVNDNLKKYVTEYRTEKARHDLEYYQMLYEEAKEEYAQAQRQYSYFVDSHQGLVMQSSRTEQARLQNELNLKYQMYNAAAQQLQTGKAKVQQETPVFAETVPPTVPQKPSKPSRKKIALLFVFVGICSGALDVFLKSKKK